MNNLFSIFDPQTHSFLSLNWASSIILITLFPSLFWQSKNSSSSLLNLMFKSLEAEFKAVLGNFSLGSTFFFLGVFTFIAMNNFLGLAPYIFTSTSHLTFAFSVALPIWIGHMAYSWTRTPKNMLAHLVPLGTPPALMPFMVIIEIVSNIIRPLTLSVRLAANMVAGHLLLTLLSSQAPHSNWAIFFLLLSALVLLATLETAVALIQAYVFSILSSLYVSDIDPKTFYSYENTILKKTKHFLHYGAPTMKLFFSRNKEKFLNKNTFKY